MILTPTVTDAGVVLLTAGQSAKFKAIIVQNPTGGNTVALKFDGADTDLTFANGLLLSGGTERVIDVSEGKGSFHNPIYARTDTAATQALRVHGIE